MLTEVRQRSLLRRLPRSAGAFNRPRQVIRRCNRSKSIGVAVLTIWLVGVPALIVVAPRLDKRAGLAAARAPVRAPASSAITVTVLPAREAGPALASASPTPTEWLTVARTDGEGVYLRRTTRMADKLEAWPDGTPLRVVGRDAEAEGRLWKNVMDPDGQTGWVPDQYVVPSPPP
jgi:hypothetical protein